MFSNDSSKALQDFAHGLVELELSCVSAQDFVENGFEFFVDVNHQILRFFNSLRKIGMGKQPNHCGEGDCLGSSDIGVL
jgi:hypothetical protein